MGPDKIKLIKKLFFILLGRFLLKLPTISLIIDNLKNVLLFTTITGVLIVSIILITFFQIYNILITCGFSSFNAVNLVIAGILIITAFFYLLTEKYISKVKSAKEKLKNFQINSASKKNKSDSNDLQLALAAFMEGFLSEKRREEQKTENSTDYL